MNDDVLVPAEVFPPGDVIKDEMIARGYSEAYLLDELGWTSGELTDVLEGNAEVTPKRAEDLARVFNLSEELWLNLDRIWRSRPRP